ncbi:MAG: hypothetical protein R3E58_13925 [Phycisphaerae bacterium]
MIDPPNGGGQQFCDDSCFFAQDGECDDGGSDGFEQFCDFSTDCSDCSVQVVQGKHVPADGVTPVDNGRLQPIPSKKQPPDARASKGELADIRQLAGSHDFNERSRPYSRKSGRIPLQSHGA